MLRGQVPQDRDPKQIMFHDIDDCDDMWTRLCFEMVKRIGTGEIWYWGGSRKVRYTREFTERWISNFSDTKHDFKPDIIFARGGFKEYDVVLRRNPQAYKIYYGAGFRRIPPKGQYGDFNLILVDTIKQLEKAKRKFPKKNVQVLIKPACDNIFRPSEDNKEYDVILVGNYNKGVDKGHDFAFPRIPARYKVLSVGKVEIKIRNKYPNIIYTGWIPRKDIPQYYAKSKVAIVCCGKEDSCPRVIPEAISCDCPILVLDRVNFDVGKYITADTGRITSKDNFVDNISDMVDNYEQFRPYSYYAKNLSLKESVKNIMGIINER